MILFGSFANLIYKYTARGKTSKFKSSKPRISFVENKSFHILKTRFQNFTK